MIKKILSSIVIVSLSIGYFPFSFGYDEIVLRDSSREALRLIEGGERYIKVIDKLVGSSDIEELKKLQTRVENGYTKIDLLEEEQVDIAYSLLYYMEDSITEVIEELQHKNIIAENTLTKEQKIDAEKSILFLQDKLSLSIQEFLSELSIELQSQERFKEIGNLEMKLDINIQENISSTSGVKFSNYTAEVQEFDQKINGYIEAFTKTNINGKELKGELKGFIDFISKDGNMYLLLQKFNLESVQGLFEENDTYMKNYLLRLQELIDSDTYLFFDSYNSQETLDLFKNITGDNSLITQSLKKPLFEAYSLSAGKYSLRPTIEFCNLGKEITSIFDPFYGKKCSEKQYKNLLLDMQEAGVNIMLQTGADNILEISIDNKEVLGNIKFNYNTKSLTKIEGNIIEPGNELVNNVSFHFIPQKELIVNMRIEGSVSSIKVSYFGNNSMQNMNFTSSYKDVYKVGMNYALGKVTGSIDVIHPFILISCKMNGNTSSQSIDVQSECTIESQYFDLPSKNPIYSKDTFTWKDNGKNNSLNYNLYVSQDNKSMVDFSVQSNGTRTNTEKREILAPKKIKNIQDFEEDVYQDTYPDGDEYFERNYDDYAIYDEKTDTYQYCNVYEYSEVDDYEYCTEYISEEEYDME